MQTTAALANEPHANATGRTSAIRRLRLVAVLSAWAENDRRAYPTSRHSELRCSDKCLRSLAKDIRERAHGWVAARAERQGAEDDVGLLRRLVPRCVRRPDVQLRDPDGDLAVGIVARRGWPHRHRDAADLVPGGMVLRDPGRQVWPGKNAPDHHPLVLVLHLPVRLRDQFRDVVRLARAPRSGVRRRVGRRC